ncbi:hypothetical protein Q4Q40_22170 [Flavivirga jejuensis]|uniref:Outer membrane efflux protein n=2 Tax=Flavivirga jejuensis TaxID=870487 RepID=A0ABT8WVJ2_9FLAO|nr:hypothetical protein [Flavivirga jejuensis]
MHTNISILQYIKNGSISINTEISNIKADLDTNIKIKQFFMNSIDFQKLHLEINQKRNQLKIEEEIKMKEHFSNELDKLYRLEKAFKIDILYLADIFSKLEIKTERLKKARDLFDQGRFKEADTILIESELSSDQFNLLLQVEYLEMRKSGILNQLLN